MKERRKSKRVPLDFKLQFSFAGKEHSVKTADVSLHGFFAETENPVPIGTTLPFAISGQRLTSSLRIVGKVVHIRKKKDGTTLGMGVQIHKIGTSQEEQFDQFRSSVEAVLYSEKK